MSVADHFDALIDAIAERVIERLDARTANASEYVDQATAPIHRATYLRAARARAFPSSRVGRRVVAKRADVVAWIESKARPALRLVPPPADPLDAIRRRMGLAPKGAA